MKARNNPSYKLDIHNCRGYVVVTPRDASFGQLVSAVYLHASHVGVPPLVIDMSSLAGAGGAGRGEGLVLFITRQRNETIKGHSCHSSFIYNSSAHIITSSYIHTYIEVMQLTSTVTCVRVSAN